MTIRIVADAGVGDWPKGAVLTIEPDREARVRRSLIDTGYAVEVKPKKKETAWPRKAS